MSTATSTDPIANYDEYVAAFERMAELGAQIPARSPDRASRASHERLWSEYKMISERVFRAPETDLFHGCWLVDNWDKGAFVDGAFVDQTADGDDLDESITTAAHVRWLLEALVAELRRLRPELAPTND